MNKISELSSVLVAKYGLSQKEADAFVVQMFDVINSGLQSSDKQVKVKGLGTFKIQSVNARESIDVNTGERIVIEGRNKISFTPETSLKNRVNLPFSQFETVIINDGVDFSDIENNDDSDNAEVSDGVDNDENGIADECPVLPEESRTKDEDAEAPSDITSDTGDDNNALDESPVVSVGQDVEEPEHHDESEKTPDETDSHEDDIPSVPDVSRNEAQAAAYNVQPQTSGEHCHASGRSNKIIISLLAFIVLLCGLGIYGMFYYQNKLSHCEDRILELEIVIDNFQEKVKKENVPSADSNKHIVTHDSIDRKANESVKDSVARKQGVPDDSNEINPDKYNKDPRIRTGAYRIVGIAKTITLKEDRSLSYISKRYLGPGMECYVEAVNEGKTFKKGETVNIPKLKLKKIRKN
ncbi:HU family DNA-binding protein [Leyella lascolaii]|uniref:HU family DNA-binding protein n=1 Tax=Leyella lascolaii TaxID=1776379 RepID=UPI00294229F2|nr:HU family DNA-binding protein [Leyella lascolaii]